MVEMRAFEHVGKHANSAPCWTSWRVLTLRRYRLVKYRCVISIMCLRVCVTFNRIREQLGRVFLYFDTDFIPFSVEMNLSGNGEDTSPFWRRMVMKT